MIDSETEPMESQKGVRRTIDREAGIVIYHTRSPDGGLAVVNIEDTDLDQ